jgi:hypothetical protein
VENQPCYSGHHYHWGCCWVSAAMLAALFSPACGLDFGRQLCYSDHQYHWGHCLVSAAMLVGLMQSMAGEANICGDASGKDPTKVDRMSAGNSCVSVVPAMAGAQWRVLEARLQESGAAAGAMARLPGCGACVGGCKVHGRRLPSCSGEWGVHGCRWFGYSGGCKVHGCKRGACDGGCNVHGRRLPSYGGGCKVHGHRHAQFSSFGKQTGGGRRQEGERRE